MSGCRRSAIRRAISFSSFQRLMGLRWTRGEYGDLSDRIASGAKFLENRHPICPFEVLFDHAEPNAVEDAAYAPYGNFGFPLPPADRPWIFSNFVQSLDGITSLLGEHASGGEISQSREDRWLMDLLRAHADGLLLGMNTMREEQRMRGPDSRGIVFRVADPKLRALRGKLGKRRERNIFVTRGAELDLSRHKVFDGDLVDSAIVTSPAGAERLRAQGPRPHLAIIAAGEGGELDLPWAIRKLRAELGIEYLLCEGGPTLYGSLARADLVDEKFLTLAPIEAGQVVPPEQERIASERSVPVLLRPTVFGGPGFTREHLTRWTWLSCRKAGDHQFNRYRRRR
jgi:riboflavin biosynthesis pyrimidine reductase